jgi:chemotaxis protein CheD
MVYVVEREGGNARTRAGIYVFPGQVIGNASGESLTTVLGASVSVCLFDPVAGVGGMSHFLLPQAVGDGASSPRFAKPSVDRLIHEVQQLGADRRRMVAKVFGGCVAGAPDSDGFHVGVRNVEAARSLLDKAQIPIILEDVGGPCGRRVVFHTGDGSARVKTFGRLP